MTESTRTEPTAAPDSELGRSMRMDPAGGRRVGTVRLALMASMVVSFLASAAAPTPLYAVYAHRWQLSPITTTEVFAVYAIAVLAALLTLGRASEYLGRKPVLLAALL
ncbi:MAG TPA: hypothetical protein VFH80_05865, partial [Solirubrobacteraceae bacterium]|nr:hypothetical protein [Solirubrobacteraceae bacterium]